MASLASLESLPVDILRYKIAPELSLLDIVRLRQCNRHLLKSFISVPSVPLVPLVPPYNVNPIKQHNDEYYFALFKSARKNKFGKKAMRLLEVILTDDHPRFLELFLHVFGPYLKRRVANCYNELDYQLYTDFGMFRYAVRVGAIRCLWIIWERMGREPRYDMDYAFADSCNQGGHWSLLPFMRSYYSQKYLYHIVMTMLYLPTMELVTALFDPDTIARHPELKRP
jgi:hypothetical protein